ncbi:hypothetical protein KSP39_PZI001494 [Platanthera zijinensis]|uniref:K Homology domain-containing protein n=1 Tax=Platanthera zijinensis TaxID=2320716 RepID=A0AAP0C048_9ASPA
MPSFERCSHSPVLFQVHTSKVVEADSADPIKDSVNPGSSTTDSQSEPEPVNVVRETLTVLKSNHDSEIVNKAGKHSVSIQVDSPLIRFVRGKWGLTQKQVEEEMGVKIILSSAKGDSSIVIEGASDESVTRASKKITNIIEQAVKSPNLDYSHFVSLPLAIHPELVEKLQSFQKSVLEEVGIVPEGDIEGNSSDDSSNEKDDSQLLEDRDVTVMLEVQNNNAHVRVNIDAESAKLSRSSTSSALGIDSSIFIKPQTFHLTVLMLKLWNKDRVAVATEVLKGVSSKVIETLENRPVSIRLSGLACMRGSPAKAHVLYAPVEEVGGEGRLLRACQVIVDAFVEAGLVLQRDSHHSLKLHATLMNARHRKRNKWTRRQDFFDAQGIFKRYGSKDWGEYVIPEAHLSQRFVFDRSGYYHCCGSIPFPGSIKIELF